MNLDVGILADRYRMTRLLATGGMGHVWLARDLALDRLVAVKVLRHGYAADAAAVSRFRNEARLCGSLTHPNVATVHDYGEASLTHGSCADRIAFLVMELVDGEPLSAVLRREGRLSAARTVQIVRQAAAGLAAVHQAGVVHRDVKPANLVLGRDGSVKITDFGIAWSASSDPLTGAGDVMGTAEYLSPEQANGALAGPQSDVYALGVVAYECLTGRRPFSGDSPVQLALMHADQQPDPLPGDVPENVRTLVDRMLVKDPRSRFADGTALLRAVDELPAAASALPDTPDAVRRRRHAAPRRRPSPLLLGLLAVLALVAATTVLLGAADRLPAFLGDSSASPSTVSGSPTSAVSPRRGDVTDVPAPSSSAVGEQGRGAVAHDPGDAMPGSRGDTVGGRTDRPQATAGNGSSHRASPPSRGNGRRSG